MSNVISPVEDTSQLLPVIPLQDDELAAVTRKKILDLQAGRVAPHTLPEIRTSWIELRVFSRFPDETVREQHFV